MIAGSLEIQLRADIARLQQDMNSARQVVSNTVSNIERAAAAAKGALAGIGIGAGLGELVRMSDEYKKYTAQIRLATDTQGQQARAMADVRRISKDAQTDLSATGVLYARISNAGKELGISQQRVADITETVNMSLKVSGATSEEARSATLQLSQAFASGTLRGEEYNAVNEAAPRLMKALADGMGVPIGALKDMASNGKITSKIMAEVLPDALKKVREEAKQVETIGGAFTVLKNNVMEYVGATTEANGTVAALTGGIGLLANNLTTVVGVVETVIAVKLVTWLKDAATGAYQSVAANRAMVAANLATAQSQANATGAALGLANARVTELRTAAAAAEGEVALALALNGVVPAQARAAVAAEAHAAALAGLSAAQGAASVTGRAMSGMLGFLGGPVGAVVTVLGLAATAWSVFGNNAKDAADKAANATESNFPGIIKSLDEQIAKHEALIRLRKQGMSLDQANKVDQRPLNELGELSKELAALNAAGAKSGLSNEDAYFRRKEVLAKILELTQKINKEQSSGAEATALTQAEARTKFMKDYANKQEQLNEKLKEAKKLLGDAFTKEDEARIRKHYTEVDHSGDAYRNLATSIREATAENRFELAVGKDASESQKARIKLDQELASGKQKLLPEQIKTIRALLDEQAATERLLATQKLQKDVLAWIIQSTQARNEAKDSLEAEEAMYGKSKEALESYMIGVRAQVELNKKVDQMRRDGMAVGDEEIAQMTREKDKYVEVMQAVAAGRAALGKADQLRQENRRFAAESIVDARQRAAAVLAIDAEQYQEAIRLAGEGTKGRKELEQEYATWYANQLAKPQLDAQRQFWESVDKTAHDTFVSILDGGKGLAQRLRDTLKNVFFDWLYSMTIKKWIVNLQTSVSSGGGVGSLFGGGQGGGSGSGIGSLLQTGKGVFDAINTGFTGLATSIGGMVSTVGNFFGSSSISAFGAGMGMSGSQAAAAAQAYNAAGMTGTGSAITSGSMVGGVATAAAGIAGGVYGGRMISGGYSAFGGSGNSAVNTGTAIGAAVGSIIPVLGTAVGALIGGLIGGATNRLFGHKPKEYTEQSIVGTLGADSFTGNTVSKWTQKGGWFRSDKNGTDTVAVDSAVGKSFADTYAEMKRVSGEFAKAMGADISGLAARTQEMKVTLGKDEEANKKAIADFFLGVGDTLARELVPNLQTFQKEGEAASATLQRLSGDYQAVDLVLSTIGRTSQEAFGAVGLASIAAREQLIKAAGGVDALVSGTAYFAQNFLTQQEQMAPIIANVQKQMADLGLSGVKTTEQFKRAAVGIDLSTEAGAAQYAQMLKIAPQFKQVADYMASLEQVTETLGETVGQTAEQLRQVNDDYCNQIAQLERSLMSASEARAADIKGMDASTLKLYERREALQAEVAAHEATQKAQADLQQQIDSLLKARMSEAEIVALETAGMDGATRALYGRLKGLQAENAAVVDMQQRNAAAVEAAKALEEKRLADQQALAMRRADLENTLYEMTHTEAEKLARVRERELAATDATLRPLQEQIYAMQDQAKAAQAAADQLAAAAAKAQAIASEHASIQRDILSLQGDTAALRKLELAALDPANKALKEQYFALQDKMEADRQAAAMAQAMAEAQARAVEEQKRAVEEQKRAAEAVKAAWQTTSDSIYSEIKRIRGDMDGGGTASLSRAQTDFAIATAQARAGDQEAYKALPALSQALLALVDANAITATDLRLARAQTMSSLDETAGILGRKYGLALPSFAVGANVLPYDMVAQVHAGERIIPAADNRELMSRLAAPASSSGADSALVEKLLGKVERLTDEVVRLREKNSEENFAIARYAMNTADALDKFEVVGLPPERTE